MATQDLENMPVDKQLQANVRGAKKGNSAATAAIIIVVAAVAGGVGAWFYFNRPVTPVPPEWPPMPADEAARKIEDCIRQGREADALVLIDNAANKGYLKLGPERGLFDPLLDLAVRMRRLQIVERMLVRGVLPNTDNPQQETLLHVAAEGNDAAMLKLLVEKGRMKVDARDVQGRTPLHAAAFFGATEAIVALIELKAPVDCEDFGGNTPLHVAVGQGQVKACSDLLARGADRSRKNGKGQTPADLAQDEMLADLLSVK